MSHSNFLMIIEFLHKPFFCKTTWVHHWSQQMRGEVLVPRYMEQIASDLDMMPRAVCFYENTIWYLVCRCGMEPWGVCDSVFANGNSPFSVPCCSRIWGPLSARTWSISHLKGDTLHFAGNMLYDGASRRAGACYVPPALGRDHQNPSETQCFGNKGEVGLNLETKHKDSKSLHHQGLGWVRTTNELAASDVVCGHVSRDNTKVTNIYQDTRIWTSSPRMYAPIPRLRPHRALSSSPCELEACACSQHIGSHQCCQYRWPLLVKNTLN